MPVLGVGCVFRSPCIIRNELELAELAGSAFGGVVHRAAPGELADVLVGAAPGDIVALEAGEYVGEFDVSGVAVIGTCSGETRITNPIVSTATGTLNATRGNSAVFDVTVSGESIGVWAAGGATLSLTNVEVDASRRIGIRVAGEASANLDHVWVHDMRPSAEDDSFGRGIQVSNQSSASLTNVSIQRVRDVGLLAIGDGASLTFQNLAIDTVSENENPSAPGTGAQAFSDSAVLAGERIAIWNVQSGALIAANGEIEIDAIYLAEVRVPETFETGVRGAIRSVGESSVNLTNVTVVDVAGPALQVDADGVASIDALAVFEIEGPLVAADELGVAEVFGVTGQAATLSSLRNGSAVSFERADVTLGASEPAIDLASASEVELRDVQVRSSSSLAVTTGGRLDASDVTFEGVRGVSLGADSSLERVVLITDGLSLGITEGVHELVDVELSADSSEAAELVGREVRIERSYLGGRLLVDGEVLVTDSVLDATAPALRVEGGSAEFVRTVAVDSREAEVAAGVLMDEQATFAR